MLKKVPWILALLSLLSPLNGRSWSPVQQIRERMGVFWRGEPGTAGPGDLVKVDRDHQARFYAAEFRVPSEMPSFLLVKTTSTRKGRLTVHLQPVLMPEELQGNAPGEDWANPGKLYDFRAVVELIPGSPQEHVLSLNDDFFESVSRAKLPFDLAGININRIGFETGMPAEEGQEIAVGEVQGVELVPGAQAAYLSEQMRQLGEKLSALPAGSPARAFWKGRVEEVETRVRNVDSHSPEPGSWRRLSEALDDLLLSSRIWKLAPRGGEGLVIGTESAMRRVSGRHERFGFSGIIADEVRVEAARNEFESFQLVVLAPQGDLKGLRLEASDLLRADGKASIAASQFQFFHQVDQWVKPSPGTAQSQVGWLPDALLPVDGAFDVAAGSTKPVWVNVRVPSSASPGDYAGLITIRTSSGASRRLRLVVKVHDFQVPQAGRFRTQGHLDLQGLTEWYKDGDSAGIRKEFYRLLLEHRFSPTSQYSRILSPVQEDIPWVMASGGNVILIGGFSGGTLEPGIIEPAYQWLVHNGYADRAIIYIGDETDDFEGVRAKALTIRRNWPGLRIMVGGSKPRPELVGYVDVWDPITYGGQTYNFDPESTTAAIERGEEVFWYTCIGPRHPFANVYNDHPLTAIRALWWQAWKYGVTGFEYWWFNWWKPNQHLRAGPLPWPLSGKEEWSSRTYDWANGDGLFVYPGPDGRPLASLRLAVVRDAIEDWEVLFLLQRAVEIAAARGDAVPGSLVDRAKKILAVPPEITSDLTHWSEDPAVYSRFRQQVYELVSALQERLGKSAFEDHLRKWDEERREWLQRKFEERVARINKSKEKSDQ